MNKSDLKLIGIVLVIAIMILFMIALSNDKNNKKAIVYYDNEIVKEIDLTIKEKKEYTVEGYNGDVKIVAEDGKIKVDTEKSPLHLCSKQGFIDKTYESIVCLPNKIIIKIVSDTNDDYDIVIR